MYLKFKFIREIHGHFRYICMIYFFLSVPRIVLDYGKGIILFKRYYSKQFVRKCCGQRENISRKTSNGSH